MLFTNHLPYTYDASFSKSHLTSLHKCKYQNGKEIFRSWKRLWFATHSHCTPLPYLDNSAARVHDLGSRSQHRADHSRWTPGHDWKNALRLWRQFIATPPITAIENSTGVWMIHKWTINVRPCSTSAFTHSSLDAHNLSLRLCRHHFHTVQPAVWHRIIRL